MGEDAVILMVIVSNVFLLSALFETYRRLVNRDNKRYNLDEERYQRHEQSRVNHYRQTEALLSIFQSIKPDLPLPATRYFFAASPDFLRKLLEVIHREKPELVVEASSGVSTLIIAYCLKKIGSGKVISLEHDAKYANITKDLISFHGLEDVAQVVHAPLIETEINGNKWLWYDTQYLKIDMPIGFLVIDGPPGHTQRLARYPALPLLFEHLLDKSTIILDDGARTDEKEIVELWKKEFECLSYEFLDFEKGAFLLKAHKKAEERLTGATTNQYSAVPYSGR